MAEKLLDLLERKPDFSSHLYHLLAMITLASLS